MGKNEKEKGKVEEKGREKKRESGLSFGGSLIQ